MCTYLIPKLSVASSLHFSTPLFVWNQTSNQQVPVAQIIPNQTRLLHVEIGGKALQMFIRTEKTQYRGKITNVKKTGPKKSEKANLFLNNIRNRFMGTRREKSISSLVYLIL